MALDHPASDSAPISSQHSLDEKDDKLSTAEPDVAQDEEQPEYFEGFRLFMIMVTINLSTLIAALDIGIIATAIPHITEDFHALNDIGWYSGACFILVGAASPLWGKLFKYFPVPWAYMTAVALYMIGSVVAAPAPNNTALIVGRAIQGLGCSGTIGGSALIIQHTAPPSRRPVLIGLWQGVFMTSTVIGPLLGGVFTTELTWRWCFWINLPIGGAALVLQVLFLRMPKHIRPTQATWRETLKHLDLPGFFILVASLVCFTLALQWGGLTKPWSDATVIATLVLWIALTGGFVLVEALQGDYAMMPLRLLKARVAWPNMLYSLLTNAADFQILFYLPIYFQAVKGQSAITSGVNTLPLVAFFALGSVMSGALVGKTRLLQPIQTASTLIGLIGIVLIYEFKINTSKAWYIGAQIPFGFGIGLGIQVPVIALQTFSKPEDIAPTTGMAFLFQAVSGAYFNTAGQSLFENRLVQTLAKVAPNVNTKQILAAGASQIQQQFAGSDLRNILDAYMLGIHDVFTFALAAGCLLVVVSLALPRDRLPAPPAASDAADKADVEVAKNGEV